MAETAVQRLNGQVRQWTRYTREEILLSWEQRTRFDDGSVSRRLLVTHGPLSEEQALEVAALWYRQLCGYLDTTWYDRAGRLLQVYLGKTSEPYGVSDRLHRMVLAYQLVGADEHGRLFADPGEYDVDVIEIVNTLQKVRELTDGPVKEMVERSLAKAYGK